MGVPGGKVRGSRFRSCSERGLARNLLLPALLVIGALPTTWWIAGGSDFGETATLEATTTKPAGAALAEGATPLAAAERAVVESLAERLGRPPARPRLEGARPPTGDKRLPAKRTVQATIALLQRARPWTRYLETWLTLPPPADAAERASRRQKVLTGLTDPVVRQNTIFLAVLTEPWDEARPWLEGLRRGTDADDAEDALCALAFSGDPDALASFRALARSPSGAAVHRLMDRPEAHDALAAEGTREARETLRAWRSIEALDRTPYFELVAFLASRFRWEAHSLGWLPREVPPPAREALLTAWLDRYPGHPGSDNMAIRIGRLRLLAEDPYRAAQWFARALALPDQDEAWFATGPLLTLCQAVLRPEQLLALANEGGREAPSRTLFLYEHARRLATGVSFAAGCRAVDDLAAREPDLPLSIAWRNRWSGPASVALSSGLDPLPADDPLRRLDTRRAPPPAPRRLNDERGEAHVGPWTRPWSPEERLAPVQDPGMLDDQRLVGQMRAWETLAELERRAQRARGNVQADLLYKQAAVLYHDRDALYPAYARHLYLSFYLWCREEPPTSPTDERVAIEGHDRRLEQFGSESFAWERAADLFQRLEREHPRYPAMDKVLFSEGMCWKRLVDYRPRGWRRYEHDGSACIANEAIRRAVECFERLVREFPQSPLADDAARAAAWWRRARAEAWLGVER
jgi:tetratricopeptide (TPR) repeat protein